MAGLRETSSCSAPGEEHGCNVCSAQWFWTKKHLGGCSWKFESFAEADLRVTSTRLAMMSFDVNTSRSLSATNRKDLKPTRVLHLSICHPYFFLLLSTQEFLQNSPSMASPNPLRHEVIRIYKRPSAPMPQKLQT